MNQDYKLFSDPSKCYGCELCALVCPVSIISMKQDREGFYYPVVTNTDKCIKCKKCELICPEKKRVVQPKEIISFYTGFAKDVITLKKSASGGAATVLSQLFIAQNGIVYGVRYSKDFKSIEYTRVETLEELDTLKGSKYAQSRKFNIFSKIISDLKAGKKVLFIGLPCDVAALYNYTSNKYDGLYTIQLICHGVTSPLVQKQYIENSIMTNNENNIVEFSVRYKHKGWKPYFIFEKYSSGKTQISPFRPTCYGIAFHYLKRPSCNSCRFKVFDKEYGIQADIILGDNHGVNIQSPSYNEWGSSVVISCSAKGEELIKESSDLFFYHKDSSQLISQNLALYKPFPCKPNRKEFADTLATKDLYHACKLPSVIYKEKKIAIENFIHAFLMLFYRPIRKYIKK